MKQIVIIIEQGTVTHIYGTKDLLDVDVVTIDKDLPKIHTHEQKEALKQIENNDFIELYLE